jgi:hypothetical protein
MASQPPGDRAEPDRAQKLHAARLRRTRPRSGCGGAGGGAGDRPGQGRADPNKDAPGSGGTPRAAGADSPIRPSAGLTMQPPVAS